MCSVMFCSGMFCCAVLSMFCSVMLCHALFCPVMFCSVMLCSVMFVEGARRDTREHREHRGLSGQLGVWRPRYAGWGWPGGLFLKSNIPNLWGGEKV